MFYLIDTRTRNCEVGIWHPTITEKGHIILRRVLSLGSLWEIKRFTVDEEDTLGITTETYQAQTSEGFTAVEGMGRGAIQNVVEVAAVLESGGRLIQKAFSVGLIPGEATVRVPEEGQPIGFNQAVTDTAWDALKKKADLQCNWFKCYVAEGQSNCFQWAEVVRHNTGNPNDFRNHSFEKEHQEHLNALDVLHCWYRDTGLYDVWSVRPNQVHKLGQDEWKRLLEVLPPKKEIYYVWGIYLSKKGDLRWINPQDEGIAVDGEDIMTLWSITQTPWLEEVDEYEGWKALNVENFTDLYYVWTPYGMQVSEDGKRFVAWSSRWPNHSTGIPLEEGWWNRVKERWADVK